MTLTVNGNRESCPDGATVATLLQQRGQAQGVAVAVNGAFVPRSQHVARELRDGDEVEIVAPMQGG